MSLNSRVARLPLLAAFSLPIFSFHLLSSDYGPSEKALSCWHTNVSLKAPLGKNNPGLPLASVTR